MKLLVWLVVSLLVLVFFTLLLGLWYWLHRRTTVLPSSPGRRMQGAAILLFSLGLGSLAVVAAAALSAGSQNGASEDDDTGEVRTGLFPRGTEAPDFSLPLLDEEGRTVSLRDFRGQKPVVLIFGSFS